MCVYILFVRIVYVRVLRFEFENMRTSGFDSRVGVCCSVLQCVAVCCSVLQCHFLKTFVPQVLIHLCVACVD